VEAELSDQALDRARSRMKPGRGRVARIVQLPFPTAPLRALA